MEWQHTRERQAAGIALAKKRGIYTGRQKGTTKAAPARARALRQQGLTVLEIAKALGVKERTATTISGQVRQEHDGHPEESSHRIIVR